MSTLEQRIVGLAQSVGADIKALNNLIGSLTSYPGLASLPGPLKASIAAMLNELFSRTSGSSSAIGDLSGLSTTDKSNLVAAINELRASIAAVDLTALISDTALVGEKAKTFSADKILTLISTVKADILGGIPDTTLDTIQELAQFLKDNTVADGLVAQLASRVRVDAVQSFSAAQQTQARANIGAAAATDLATLTTNIGNTDHDFVADYTTAKA